MVRPAEAVEGAGLDFLEDGQIKGQTPGWGVRCDQRSDSCGHFRSFLWHSPLVLTIIF